MSERNVIQADFTEGLPRVSPFRRFRRVFFSRGVVKFGFTVIVILILCAIAAPLLAPYPPNEMNLRNKLAEPSPEHLLGTDTLGRDILSRIIYGAQVSLAVGIMSIGLAAVIGLSLGLIAGYLGGKTYAIIMRCIDTLMAIPPILLALTISALLGGGLKNVVIALGVAMIPACARLMCGQVLSVRENDYILAGHAIGASALRIMLRHIAPNCFPPLIVLLTLQMGHVILAEAGLSFLGAGIGPPTASWGAMVADGNKILRQYPLLSIAPGAVIMLTVFAFNMVGDGMRDALDPRLRGRI